MRWYQQPWIQTLIMRSQQGAVIVGAVIVVVAVALAASGAIGNIRP